MTRPFAGLALALCLASGGAASAQPDSGASESVGYDLVIRGGLVYDGSGGEPYAADVAVRGDRIAAIASHIQQRGKVELDARGKAVSPGFINMLSHPEESLLVDGRALSDLSQGVTLEVIGEDSMGPLTPRMKALMAQRETDISFPVTWTTLGQYMEGLEKKGISPNVAAFVGEGTVRANLLGAASARKLTGQVVNIGEGRAVVLNDLCEEIARVLDRDVAVERVAPRAGDIRHSVSDITAARELLGYEPLVRWEDGLAPTIAYMRALRADGPAAASRTLTTVGIAAS